MKTILWPWSNTSSLSHRWSILYIDVCLYLMTLRKEGLSGQDLLKWTSEMGAPFPQGPLHRRQNGWSVTLCCVGQKYNTHCDGSSLTFSQKLMSPPRSFTVKCMMLDGCKFDILIKQGNGLKLTDVIFTIMRKLVIQLNTNYHTFVVLFSSSILYWVTDFMGLKRWKLKRWNQ